MKWLNEEQADAVAGLAIIAWVFLLFFGLAVPVYPDTPTTTPSPTMTPTPGFFVAAQAVGATYWQVPTPDLVYLTNFVAGNPGVVLQFVYNSDCSIQYVKMTHSSPLAAVRVPYPLTLITASTYAAAVTTSAANLSQGIPCGASRSYP